MSTLNGTRPKAKGKSMLYFLAFAGLRRKVREPVLVLENVEGFLEILNIILGDLYYVDATTNVVKLCPSKNGHPIYIYIYVYIYTYLCETWRFSFFPGDFDLQQLPFGRLWGLREWKTRVLMEKYYVSHTSGKPKKRPREYFVLNCREQTAALPSPLATFCKLFYQAVSGHFRDAYWLHLLPPDAEELTTCHFELEGELTRAKGRAKCHGKDELEYITLNAEEYGPLASSRSPSPFWCALAGEEPKRLHEYRIRFPGKLGDLGHRPWSHPCVSDATCLQTLAHSSQLATFWLPELVPSCKRATS